MTIDLLDDTLRVKIYYEQSDRDYCDNVCIRFWESCPEDERLFRAEETNIYLTVEEAVKLARMLLQAAENSLGSCTKDQASK